MNREPHSGQESVSVATSRLGIAISPFGVGTLVHGIQTPCVNYFTQPSAVQFAI